MGQKTKVSVLMPVLDGEEFLLEAVESILFQTFQDFEFVIVDDGSRDATPSILRACAAHDNRIRVLDNPGSGIVDALNFGLEVVTAPLVARMDADDRARPNRLAAQHKYMSLHPEVLVVGTQVSYIDGQGRDIRPSRQPVSADAVRTEMSRGCCIRHPTVMMRRQEVLETGGYRKAFSYAEDYDLWLRLLDKGDIVNLDMTGLDFRLHDGMTSMRHDEAQALQGAAARLLAGMRLKGLAEPELENAPINARSLRQLDISERELAKLFRKTAFHSAHHARIRKDKAALRRCLTRSGPLRLPQGGLGDIVDYARQWIGVFW